MCRPGGWRRTAEHEMVVRLAEGVERRGDAAEQNQYRKHDGCQAARRAVDRSPETGTLDGADREIGQVELTPRIVERIIHRASQGRLDSAWPGGYSRTRTNVRQSIHPMTMSSGLGPVEYALLGLLKLTSRHGYDLVGEFRRGTDLGEALKVDRSNLYAALKRLERHGLVTANVESIGRRRPRHVYHLT